MKTLFFFLLFPLCFGSACDWRVFDDLQSKATVQVIEPPKNFSGTNFGQVVSPVFNENGSVVANTFFAGGYGTSPLAVISLDTMDGSIVRKAFFFHEGVSVSMLASLPAKEGQWRAVISDGRFQSVSVFSLHPSREPHEMNRIAHTGGGSEFGSAIATRDLDGDGNWEILVTSQQGLSVFDDLLDQSLFFRWPEGFSIPTLQELTESGNQTYLTTVKRLGNTYIVVGGYVLNEQNQRIWAVLLIPFTREFPEVEPLLLTGNADTPGTSVCTLAGNLMSHSTDHDLVVGACKGTYIFAPTLQGDEPYVHPPRIRVLDESQNLGQIVALVDIDSSGTPELVVAEPDRPAGSGKNGRVSIFRMNGDGEPTPEVVIQAPENEKRFGSSLFGLKTSFLNHRLELVVGGANSSYLFFITGINGDNDPSLHDPRRLLE